MLRVSVLEESPSAIYGKNFPSHVCGVVGGQKRGYAGGILWLAYPAQGHMSHVPVVVLFLGPQLSDSTGTCEP